MNNKTGIIKSDDQCSIDMFRIESTDSSIKMQITLKFNVLASRYLCIRNFSEIFDQFKLRLYIYKQVMTD